MRQVAQQFLVGLGQTDRTLFPVDAGLLLDLDQFHHQTVESIGLRHQHLHRQGIGRAQRQSAQVALEAPGGHHVGRRRGERGTQGSGFDHPLQQVAAQQGLARHTQRVLELGIGEQALARGPYHGHHRRQQVEGLQAQAHRVRAQGITLRPVTAAACPARDVWQRCRTPCARSAPAYQPRAAGRGRSCAHRRGARVRRC